MKTLRYRFEQAVQEVNEETTEWLIDEFKAILESDKDYTRKADYIGFSIASIDSKVASIDEELKELQSLKKKLKLAKDIALRIGAEVFAEYGIDRLEGAGISSITLTKPSHKTKYNLEMQNEDALIAAGFYTIAVDQEAVTKAYEGLGSESDQELVKQHCTLSTKEVLTPSKLKINKRRGVNTDNYSTTEEIAS